MTIEKIACPVLNKSLKPASSVSNSVASSAEVFVRFSKPNCFPLSIMCPYYNPNGTCGFEDTTLLENQECIYSHWTDIVRAPIEE